MNSSLHTKRKAEGSPELHPAQRTRYNCVDNPLPSVVGRIAEEGSLNFIIRNNDPRRLYVKPIAWTSDHLQLLECTFLRRKRKLSQKSSSASGKDNSPSQAGRSQLSKDAIELKRLLRSRSISSFTKILVREILDAYDIHPQGSQYLSFSFNRRQVTRLTTEGVFASRAGPSSMAYISFVKIEDIRRRHFRGVKGAAHPFTPKDQWVQKCDIESPHLAQDPYLVAILIALAQDQRRHQQREGQDTDTTKDVALPEPGSVSCQNIKPKGPSPTHSFKVQVLAVYGQVALYFYVYTAIIPAEFPDKFDKPWQCSSGSPVAVKCGRIAVQEEGSLERLHRILFCTGNHPLNRRRSWEASKPNF